MPTRAYHACRTRSEGIRPTVAAAESKARACIATYCSAPNARNYRDAVDAICRLGVSRQDAERAMFRHAPMARTFAEVSR